MRFRRIFLCLLTTGLIGFATSAASPGQTTATDISASTNLTDARIASLIDSLGNTRTPVTVAISPDGTSVAWSVGGRKGSELHLTGINPDGSRNNTPERLISPDTVADTANHTAGACTAAHPAWSPDGKQLAFLSDCSGSGSDWEPNSQNNIFVWTTATNTMKQVSHLHGAINSLIWSPDGKSIGFLFVENATRSAGALAAMKPWNGVYGEDGVEIQRVYAIDVATARGNWISYNTGSGRLNLHVYEFTWAPDSQHIAFVAASPPGENNWWTAKLYKESTGYIAICEETPLGEMCRSGSAPPGPPEPVFDPTTATGPLHNLQIAVPRFSPDGKQIAFIGGLMSDQGSIGGDIYLIPSSGLAASSPSSPAEPKNITPNRPASPAYLAWIDNHTLGITEHVGGSSHITALDLNTGKDIPSINLTLPDTIIAGVDVMSVSSSMTSNNSNLTTVAFTRQSHDHPPEVWAGPLNNMKQLTHLNDTRPILGKSESIDYSNEGFHIQGWLLYPINYDPSKKYPLIVSVHGGPSSAVMPRWPSAAYSAVPFSALGYFVFLPNPRGSYGQGEEFTQANRKDFGYGDLRDILAGMDVLEKRFPIDKQREGITGWSYGGFMTMFAVTHTTRFKAAVAGAGISNWQSYYGENSIDQWMTPFFGATVYDDPKVYARSSPIEFIKNAKTPTLMVVGDRDGECPAPQSFEFWHALKAEGVKSQLVVYPNEGHHFGDPEHQRDVLQRALAWFEAEMPAK